MGTWASKHLKYIAECVLDVLYEKPEKCLVCSNDLHGEEYICTDCEKKIRYCVDTKSVQFDGIIYKCFSSAFYSEIISKIVLLLKYSHDMNSADFLCNMMKESIERFNLKPDILTFVPCSKNTRKKRGFNQSEILAKKLSFLIGIPCESMLIKTKDTKDQIGLKSAQRWNNLKNAFLFKYSKNITNKKILLIDDVLTTGATAVSCAGKIKNNGALSINILTAARSRL